MQFHLLPWQGWDLDLSFTQSQTTIRYMLEFHITRYVLIQKRMINDFWLCDM